MISVGKTQKKTVTNELCTVFVKALSLTGMKLAQDLKGPCSKHGAAVMAVFIDGLCNMMSLSCVKDFDMHEGIMF